MNDRTTTVIVAAMSVFVCWTATAEAAVCEEIGTSTSLSIPVIYPTGKVDKRIYDGSYALIVGANQYRDWEQLPAVVYESQELRDALVGQGFKVRRICDPQAEGSGGLSEIARFLDEFAKSNNRVLVFISGHGWVDEGAYRGVFAAVDSPQPTPTKRIEARKKGLASEDLIVLAKRSHARHLMFVVDACYSAAIFTSKSPDRTVKVGNGPPPSLIDFEEITKTSKQFLTAGADDQETPSPSIFTPAFILGISGFADLNGDGIVRESELAPWLRETVSKSLLKPTTPRAGYIPESTSQISSGGGEMVFRYDPLMKQTVRAKLKAGGADYLGDLAYVNPDVGGFWPDPKYRVSYFEKRSDEGQVIRALDAASIPYLTMKAILRDDNPTNGLACHPETPTEVVRAAARALIQGGIKLRIIDRATVRVDERRYVVQALEFGRMRDTRYRDITLDDLGNLNGCPQEFHFDAR